MWSRSSLILFVILPFVIIRETGLSGSMQGHMVQGSEQVRCRGGSFKGADSQHMLLVYTCPGMTLIEKWLVFNIHHNISFCLSPEIPQPCFSQPASLWASQGSLHSMGYTSSILLLSLINRLDKDRKNLIMKSSH